MIENLIMALTFLLATCLSYRIGHKDGWTEGFAIGKEASGPVDNPPTVH